MKKLEFTTNPEPTVGVEIELALVDSRTMALTSAIQSVLDSLPREYAGAVKPELMQCYLEVNTGICRTAPEVREDLAAKLRAVEGVCDRLGLALLWTGTHPFSLWAEQEVTPSERYEMLVGLLQDMARQLVTFGLHVHVGVDSGDKAIQVCEQILPYLPLMLAITANSPFWENRVTGLHSSRSKVMEALPTAGLPARMRNWSEYTWLINHLVETGFINTIREIWWDVRPHHNFGTVEVRICDMPADLEECLAVTALVQCLVSWLSDRIDEGAYRSDSHPMIVRQNKWRAARYGTEARLVDAATLRPRTVGDWMTEVTERLAATADRLDCSEELSRCRRMAEGPSPSRRQLDLLRETGDPVEMARRLVARCRLT